GFTTTLSDSPCDSVVISQAYGGGGNAGATFANHFVELHNRGTTTVDVTGWAIQYASATGSTWSVNTLTGSIPAGGYYLVQLASGGANGSPLPTPDDTGTSNMAGANGKVALTSDSVALTGTCPTGGAIQDFLGYGATASCFEGAGPTLSLTNTTSAQRNGAGCDDTDSNSADFTAALPVPRNSTTAALTCCAPTVANESGDADEADFCNVQFPTSITMTTAGSTQVFGQIFEAGVTEAAGNPGTITAELGYGPRTANPQHEAGWTFIPAAYNVQSGNNDEFEATLTGLAAGTYGYAFRFSLDGGTSWTYCDVNGAGSNAGLDFETPQIPEMIVTP
ncbi:MAG TPA: lamin tail domain-containing protein, partial [Polyangiaceae bacterium]|nr:lamin tail domain-containing protein [Polyangiaceae bacterium]